MNVVIHVGEAEANLDCHCKQRDASKQGKKHFITLLFVVRANHKSC